MVTLRKVLQVIALITPLYSVALAAPEVDEDGTFAAISHKGNRSGILLGRSPFENNMIFLDKRQQCAAGYGTCPGGRQCACPASDSGQNTGCCGSICGYKTDTCCKGYICDAGWGCCGTDGCYPRSEGAQCCFDGTFCKAGRYCIRRTGESYARCRVSSGSGGGGGSDEGDTGSASISATTRSYTAQPTSYTLPTTSTSLYTVTFTFYYYIYAYTSTVWGRTTSYHTSSWVTYDYTSSSLVLSTSATGSFAATDLLSPSAAAVETSLSQSAESMSSSMQAVVDSFSSSQSRVDAAASSSTTRTTTDGINAGLGNGNGNIGGGGGTSRASQIRVRDGTALVLFSALVVGVGGLMIAL